MEYQLTEQLRALIKEGFSHRDGNLRVAACQALADKANKTGESREYFIAHLLRICRRININRLG